MLSSDTKMMKTFAVLTSVSMIFCYIFFVETKTIKVTKDSSIHNINQINVTSTIFNIDRVNCVRECAKVSGENSNLRKFVASSAKCECIHANQNFRDSRQVAPEMDGVVFYAAR